MTRHDDIPTHDCYGTDLARVARMLEQGYSIELIAEALGITVLRARYAVIVATGDREGAPDEDELAALVAEIQSGWTAEQAAAARRGESRFSSAVVSRRVVQSDATARAALMRRTAMRVHHGRVPISPRRRADGSIRFEARVEIELDGRRTQACRVFDTRDEAEAWGRDWLTNEWRKRQAEACCGI